MTTTKPVSAPQAAPIDLDALARSLGAHPPAFAHWTPPMVGAVWTATVDELAAPPTRRSRGPATRFGSAPAPRWWARPASRSI